MRILLSLNDHPSTDLNTLIDRLRKAGIWPTGGADLGDQKALLFRRPEDTDQAIVLLKQMGIDARRG